MSHNRPSIVLCCILVSSVAHRTDVLGAEPPPSDTILDRVRRGLPAKFTIEVEVDRPATFSWRGQGETTLLVRATVDEETIAVVWRASQSPAPRYYPPGTSGYEPIDYDLDDNLICSFRSEGATIRDLGIHEEYSETVGYRVAPNGKTFLAETVPTLSRRDPSETNSEALNLLRRILWALGRPLPEGFGRVIEEETSPTGSHRVRATAWWGSSRELAESDVSIDPREGHLVRHATFGPRGDASAPECSSEGTRRFGPVTLAERGEFTIPSIERIAVRPISFSSTFDSALADEALKVISRSNSRRVRVVDYRDDKDHPTAQLAKPGELKNRNWNLERRVP